MSLATLCPCVREVPCPHWPKRMMILNMSSNLGEQATEPRRLSLHFRVPEIVFLQLDEAFGRTEADEEIQDLLQWSRGLNLGLHFLSGALTFDPIVHQVDVQTASQVVWLDALLTNVDRTIKNTNMLMWHKELWLIDHGAALYFHHSWENWQKQAVNPFLRIKDHVLLPYASQLEEADNRFKQILTEEKLQEITDAIPDDWLTSEPLQYELEAS